MRALLTRFAASAILSAAVLTGAAHAATLNIDFYNNVSTTPYSGVGAATDSGTVWNAIGPGLSFGGLSYSDGSAATGVVIGSNFESQHTNVGGGNHPLLADRLIASSATSAQSHTVTISGLQSGSYDLYAYAGFYSELFTVGSQSASATGANYNVGPGAWQQGVQYALLTGLNVGPSGILVLSVLGLPNSPFDGSLYTTIAGLQLQQTPIPPALPLFATGLGLLHYLSRRKKVSRGPSREA